MAFRRTAASATALLAELRAFAAALPRGAALPPSLPHDAPRVLAGGKRLLDDAQPLTFACTGCGACCRAYAPSVLLDPRDVALLAPHLPGQPRAAGDVSAALPRHFTRRVGSFPLAALPPSAALRLGGSLLGLPLARAEGTAPVLFLRAQGRGAGARCALAAPARGGGLRCSLGKAGMPLACALYPLGAFLPAEGSGAGALPALYTQDGRGACEGLGAAGARAGAAPEPARAYLARGALAPRLASAAWWQALATAWACSGVEADAAALGPAAQAPAAWLAAGAEGGSGSGSGSGGSQALLPSPLLLALRSRLRAVWYSPRQWVEGEAEAAIERETLELHREARAAIAAAS